MHAYILHFNVNHRYLAKILAPEGSKDVLVGQPIAITVSFLRGFPYHEQVIGTSYDSFVFNCKNITRAYVNFYQLFCKVEDPADIETVKKSVTGDSTVKDEKSVPRDTSSEVRVQKASFSRISPSAKLLIAEHGLDATSITASGLRGTLLKGDVLAAIKSGKGAAKTSSSEKKTPSSPQIQAQASSPFLAGVQQSDSFEDFPNSQIRKVRVLAFILRLPFNLFVGFINDIYDCHFVVE